MPFSRRRNCPLDHGCNCLYIAVDQYPMFAALAQLIHFCFIYTLVWTTAPAADIPNRQKEGLQRGDPASNLPSLFVWGRGFRGVHHFFSNASLLVHIESYPRQPHEHFFFFLIR